MLTVQALRKEAYYAWELLCGIKGVYTGAQASDELPEAEAEYLPWQNELFKSSIRQQYGDLRQRHTWEQAAIDLTAHHMVQSYLEPYQIVGYMASPSFMACPIREHYGEQVVDRMWQFPEMTEIIAAGLEQLYYTPTQAQDPELAISFMTGEIAARLTTLKTRQLAA
jgi:hypothetical protein